MPVSCETSLSEKILPEKDLPGVKEGSIGDGAAKRCCWFGVGILMCDAHVTSESSCARDLCGGLGG